MRTAQRIRLADERDKAALRKYLPSSPLEILPVTISAPDDFAPTPDWLMRAVTAVASTKQPAPSAPPIRFSVDADSVAYNTELLARHNYDIDQLLCSSLHTTLGHGSEFRPLSDLQSIFGAHPNFPLFEQMMRHGMSYHFERELTEDERIAELVAILNRGNHKSAANDPHTLLNLLTKDVEHGFSLPISREAVLAIPHALAQPAGLVKQHTLTETGDRVLKTRLTQDLSHWEEIFGASVNERLDLSQYSELIYGYCLSRLVHFIVSLRLSFPNQRILMSKYDFSDAYRRITHAGKAAAQSIIVVGSIAFVALRLSFGGASNPAAWSTFSEMVTDLSNEIACADNWDPSTVYNHEVPPPQAPKVLDDKIPFGQAYPMSVKIPTTLSSRVDCFIDDLINVFLDTTRNRQREPHKVPLAVYVAMRPHAGTAEPIKRRDILANNKLHAEGTPAEIQTVLGWSLNTRLLTIAITKDKFLAWTRDLDDIIADRSTTFGELESVIGRMNHAGFIIPLARHFLDRIRRRLLHRLPKQQRITLRWDEIDDLQLWRDVFLPITNQGLSLNLITLRNPDSIGWSDSCPYGGGGFLNNGRAWRIVIPKSSIIHGHDRVNNVLEFLCIGVNILLMIHDAQHSHQCFLAIGDSTSGLGWIIAAGRLKPDSAYYLPVHFIARHIARSITLNGHCIARQHLSGDLNTVSDLLSFSGDDRLGERHGKPHPFATADTSDDELTKLFHLHTPHLIPQNFVISPLPHKILCFTTQALRIIEYSLHPNKNQASNARTVYGNGGWDTAGRLDSSITPSSISSPTKPQKSSSVASFPPIVQPVGPNQATLLANLQQKWQARLFEVPQAIWLRRFGTISRKVPCTTRAGKTSDLASRPSSEPLTMSTLPLNGKKL